MLNIPIYINLILLLTTIVAIFLFYKATNNSKIFLWIVSFWVILQSILSISDFYKITNTLPPRFILLLMPPLLLTTILFSTKAGQSFINNLDLKMLTLFHIIRIPIEITLFLLSVHKAVPVLMTFEGRNFDILSGMSALIVYYFSFKNEKINSRVLLAWNLICLVLLFNIVFNAILSIPSVFQQFAFDQPNVAILYFPFVLVPSLLVPLVLLSHLASLKRLLK